jgi:hypothetical protein
MGKAKVALVERILGRVIRKSSSFLPGVLSDKDGGGCIGAGIVARTDRWSTNESDALIVDREIRSLRASVFMALAAATVHYSGGRNWLDRMSPYMSTGCR